MPSGKPFYRHTPTQPQEDTLGFTEAAADTTPSQRAHSHTAWRIWCAQHWLVIYSQTQGVHRCTQTHPLQLCPQAYKCMGTWAHAEVPICFTTVCAVDHRCQLTQVPMKAQTQTHRVTHGDKRQNTPHPHPGHTCTGAQHTQHLGAVASTQALCPSPDLGGLHADTGHRLAAHPPGRERPPACRLLPPPQTESPR